MTQKITPNLWFDGNAKEAADFYVAHFPGGKINSASHYPQTAEEGLADFQQDLAGKVLTVEFELAGLGFTGINAGPEFKMNPSISFMVNFDPAVEGARDQLDQLWAALSEGGKVLMALDKYNFGERYGWIQDKYGCSWQLTLAASDGRPVAINPSLMFGGPQVNRAEEAIEFYTSVFKDSRAGAMARYGTQTGPAQANSLMYADFVLSGQTFGAMDSGVEQDFTFNEGISLLISCADQAEIDYFWSKLSTDPAAEQCGWCKDQFGVAWQVCPANMEELMARPDAFKHMMEMKKLVIADF